MPWIRYFVALLMGFLVHDLCRGEGLGNRPPLPKLSDIGYYPRLNPLHLFNPRTKPKYQTGIPLRDYQYRATSPTVTYFSKTAVLIEHRSQEKTVLKANGKPKIIPGGILLKKTRVFQLDVANLVIHHCSISQVAFTLENDGVWTLSLRADQNPLIQGPSGSAPPFLPQLGPETDFLKRNEFFVTIRCHSFFAQTEQEQLITTGKPVLFQLKIPPFWVQRAEPYFLSQRGISPDVIRYFEEVDRIEIEFYYR